MPAPPSTNLFTKKPDFKTVVRPDTKKFAPKIEVMKMKI